MNIWWIVYFFVNSFGIFDNIGFYYNIMRVFILGIVVLDEIEYKNYLLLFYGVGSLVSYGVFFVFYFFIFVFIILDMW